MAAASDGGGRILDCSSLGLREEVLPVSGSSQSSISTYAASVSNFSDRNNLIRNKSCQFRVPRSSDNGFARHLRVLEACAHAFGGANVACLQDKQDGRFQITFVSAEVAEAAVSSGFLFDNSAVVVSPLSQSYTKVFIKNAPFEMPNKVICDLLSQYGRVRDIQFVHFKGKFNNISTGERRVLMDMTKEIPNCVKFGDFTLWLNYHGVVKQCKICLQSTHLVAKCPNVSRCSICGGKGHSQSSCKMCMQCNVWCVNLDAHSCLDNDSTQDSSDCSSVMDDVEEPFVGQEASLGAVPVPDLRIDAIEDAFPSRRSSMTLRSPPQGSPSVSIDVGLFSSQLGQKSQMSSKKSSSKINSKSKPTKPPTGAKGDGAKLKPASIRTGECVNMAVLSNEPLGSKKLGMELRDKRHKDDKRLPTNGK